MAYSTDLSALGIKFNKKNETNYEISWLLCGKCDYWLTSPIFMHQDGKNYCANCRTELEGGMRNKALETLLQKAQFPCINEQCPSWFSFENIQKHKGVCKFNVFNCNFCTDQCTETEYLEHMIANHSEVCDNIKLTNSSLNIKFKKNSKGNVKLIVGDYDSGKVVIHAKTEKEHVYIGIAFTQFDDTMKIETGHQYRLEDKCDGIFGKIRLGKFMSMRQFGNLSFYDIVLLRKNWKEVEINITLKNLGNSITFADCPICMYPMKESIVLCENGHPVCNSCAPKIEKCAVCRVTMGKVTLRLSDVIQSIPKLENVDVKCGTSSKLAENASEAQSVAMDDNSTKKCPECNVEMTMNVLVDHFNQYHKGKLIPNGLWKSNEIKEIFYIIYDGNIFKLTLIKIGQSAKISAVYILTSNDSNVAKRYHYEFLINSSNGQVIRNIGGTCKIESELMKSFDLDSDYRRHKLILFKV